MGEEGEEQQRLPFQLQWAQEVRSSLFGEVTPAAAGDFTDADLVTLRRNVRQHAADLAFEEETYLQRHSLA